MIDHRNWVTIVSGLPRSGTSMMMQMLEAGGLTILTDQVRQADQDNPRGYYEFEPVKRTKQDPSWLSGAVGKAVKLVHLLLYDLPAGYDYRVLLMHRKIEQVLVSQQKMLKRLGREGSSLSAQQLAAAFESQLQKIATWLAQQPNFTYLDVDYNRLIESPAPRIDPINQFLGGSLDTLAMAGVIDPALYRQRL